MNKCNGGGRWGTLGGQGMLFYCGGRGGDKAHLGAEKVFQ